MSGLAWAGVGWPELGELFWAGLIWAELGWAGLGWPAPAWAGLAAKVGMCRVGHGAPVQPRRCTELRAHCGELPRTTPDYRKLSCSAANYNGLP